jgi:transposase
MKRFIEGEDRRQALLLPDCLEDYVSDENPVRVIEAFIDELDLRALGFEGVVPEATGRPGYHPAAMLKIYLYGYLNRIPSSRRLERETQRNMELIWLTGRLMPDFKTIADFRKDNGALALNLGGSRGGLANGRRVRFALGADIFEHLEDRCRVGIYPAWDAEVPWLPVGSRKWVSGDDVIGMVAGHYRACRRGPSVNRAVHAPCGIYPRGRHGCRLLDDTCAQELYAPRGQRRRSRRRPLLCVPLPCLCWRGALVFRQKLG